MKKRVTCLYRVSTMKQVDKDDIPMQRNSCRDFIKKQEGWVLEKEYLEKGISGYIKKEKDRDALQDIKKDVLNKKIDVLLVFMFDRIGRRDDETPFVVQWLIENGIEVWSVKEGQRKIENRTDKLLNYITYWQAGGESEKTSIRVKEMQMQMAKDGILTYGGNRNAPYGYNSVKSGTYTKKGVERCKLVINSEEEKVIKKIFELAIKRGYGISRIAKYLNENKIKTKRNAIWQNSSVYAILNNPIYMGYPAYNKTSGARGTVRTHQTFENWIFPNKKIEELAIISEEDWYKAKDIRNSKVKGNSSNKPMQTKSPLLFIGIMKCGYCKRKMNSKSSTKIQNGHKYCYYYYRCPSQMYSYECDLEKKIYRKEYLEDSILKIVYDYLDDILKINIDEDMVKKKFNNLYKEKEELEKIEAKICEKENELELLKQEVVKTLTGTSIYSSELLNELINDKKIEIDECIEIKDKLKNSIAQRNLEKKDLENFKNIIPAWKDEFENADIEIKKMLLTDVIDEIRVFNTIIEVDLRLRLNYNNYKNITMIKSFDNKKIIEKSEVIEKDA